MRPRNLRALQRDLNQIAQKVRRALRNPSEVADQLGEWSPWIAQRYLSNASALGEPHLAAMGLRVRKVEDEGVQVELPFIWKNRCVGTSSFFHGSLLSASEYAVLLFWNRFVDLATSEVVILESEVQVNGRIQENVLLNMGLAPSDRDPFLFELQSQGKASLSVDLDLFSEDKILLGKIELKLRVRSALALPASEV